MSFKHSSTHQPASSNSSSSANAFPTAQSGASDPATADLYLSDESHYSHIGSHFAAHGQNSYDERRDSPALDNPGWHNDDTENVPAAYRSPSGTSAEGSWQLSDRNVEPDILVGTQDGYYPQHSQFGGFHYPGHPFVGTAGPPAISLLPPVPQPNNHSTMQSTPNGLPHYGSLDGLLLDSTSDSGNMRAHPSPYNYRPPDPRICGNAHANEGYPGPSQTPVPIERIGTSTSSSSSRRSGRRRGEYGCDQCDTVFTRPGDLRRHKEDIHDGVRYRCEQHGCAKITKRIDKMIQHSRKEHHGYVLYSRE